MNTYDIVSRLRLTPVLMHADAFGQSKIDYEACKKYVNEEGVKLMLEAASEIERLRAELHRLQDPVSGPHFEYQQCAMERDRLRSERNLAENEVLKQSRAHRAKVAQLVSKTHKLTAERDDARMLYCWVLEAHKRGDGREEAKKRGWDCIHDGGIHDGGKP